MFRSHGSVPAVANSGSPVLGMVSAARGVVIALFDHVLDWQERSAQRRQLLRLDDHALKDVGLTRSEARREASKPFWRV